MSSPLPRRLPPNSSERLVQVLSDRQKLLNGRSRTPQPVQPQVPTTTGIPSLVDVEHGDDPDVARPVARKVFWIGAATPANAQKSDLWYPSNDF